MFCFQCEQTAKGTGCTVSGICGKKPTVAKEQDVLTCEIIALAQVSDGRKEHVDLIVDGLFVTVTNVNFDEKNVSFYIDRLKEAREEMNGTISFSAKELFHGDNDIVSLRSTLLFGLRGMAAYAHHARVLGYRDHQVDQWFIKGMTALTDDRSVDEWLDLLMEFCQINLLCMDLLDKANTTAYGNPIPTEVSLTIEKGPFIVITGHDLHDLKMLLEQSQGKGVNIYTHSEMLPAHGYPELKKYTHLKGNFGTAWQNQQKEFDNIPAPILFTTNCLMPVQSSYSDRVYTTSVMSYPEMEYIQSDENGQKDFSGIIEQALQLGGYDHDIQLHVINHGTTVTTGFGRQTVLDNAPTIIDGVKKCDIKHFFLVGGCDGAKAGRNYYTDFVKQTPKDTIILTLACGKYRINDLDIGSIGDFPRILDMGQCNDAYGAIQVALALAEAFECNVNELPLTLVLSWYEQKAVCILLTLLSLNIHNIYIGPSLPAFFSQAVLNALVDKFELHPISTPEQDLATILSK